MKKLDCKLLVVVMMVLLLFLVLPSCTKHSKAFQDMTSKEKATWMLSVYNAQYDDYKFQAARLDLDEVQKKLLRSKKEVFTEVYPLIMTYTGYVDSGVIPVPELETMIVTNLERLLGML